MYSKNIVSAIAAVGMATGKFLTTQSHYLR